MRGDAVNGFGGICGVCLANRDAHAGVSAHTPVRRDIDAVGICRGQSQKRYNGLPEKVGVMPDKRNSLGVCVVFRREILDELVNAMPKMRQSSPMG